MGLGRLLLELELVSVPVPAKVAGEVDWRGLGEGGLGEVLEKA